MCLGFVRNYSGFVGVRALLGVTEGGLFPGIVCCSPILDEVDTDGKGVLSVHNV
jgi:hypothetical protein